jgi:hypothetical protein
MATSRALKEKTYCREGNKAVPKPQGVTHPVK